MAAPSMPTQFATAESLSADEIANAPVRLPRPSRLRQPLPTTDLGPRAARALDTLGLHTVGDLLEHLPRARGEARTVATLQHGETATVLVEVRKIDTRSVRRRGMKPRVAATVADATGSMEVSFFNQPWLAQRYPPGTRLLLTVRTDPRGRTSVTAHAPTDLQVAGEAQVAQYPASEGIDSTRILALMRESRDMIADTIEPLPARLRAQEELPDRPASLSALHFPGNEGDAEGGRRRLAFDELLLVQLALLRRRARREHAAVAPSLDAPRELTARWLASGLPFPLTGDQANALEDIDHDLAQAHPMQRLLMGEVGSGKTVVALFALLRAVEQGWQGALDGPDRDARRAALRHDPGADAGGGRSRSTADRLHHRQPPRRRARQARLRRAEPGRRHARADRARRPFARLAVAVVDEQHRFGVRQRAALDAKGPAPTAEATDRLTPHVLHMTATPIPRTLALVEHGDLDHTSLKELPRGRRPIETHVASGERERERAYERIREELRAGRQAFVVCPLVEESDTLQAKAARAEFERLRDSGVQRLPRRADARPAAPAREAGSDGRVRRRRRRRARRHLRDRGRHRRPQRDRDARRGRRALRHQPAAPAARAHRPRRARVAVPAVRPEGLRPPEGARRASRRLPARADRPRAAPRGRADRRAPARRGALPHRDAARRRRPPGARARPCRCAAARRPGPRGPRHALLADALAAAYGPEALAPIPA